MDTYVFPSIFIYEDTGISIIFPDLNGCVSFGENEQAVFSEAFMPAFRARQENKYVKKTLTIPEWLNIIAEREGINFSQVLQATLKEQLQAYI